MREQKIEQIQEIANCVRNHLDLPLPLTLEGLMEGIEKINGKCIPDKNGELGSSGAKFRKLDLNKDGYEFEILYNEKYDEKSKIFDVARELYLFLMEYTNQE